MRPSRVPWAMPKEMAASSGLAPRGRDLASQTSHQAPEAPFDIQSIYHDDRFTYIKTNAREKFSVYEMKDGKPNLVTYDLREGTYIIPKIMDSGYVELGKKRMEFTRKGSPS